MLVLASAGTAAAAERAPIPADASAALEGGDAAGALALAQAAAERCTASARERDACFDIWEFVAQAGLAADRADVAEIGARRAIALVAPDSEDGIGAAVVLASVLQARGRYADAEPLLRAALATAIGVEGAGGAGAAIISARLAAGLIATGNWDEAERLARRAVAVLSAMPQVPPELLAGVLVQHGLALAMLDRHAEAEPVLRRALTMTDSAGLGGTKELANATLALGIGLMGQARYADAAAMLARAVDLCERQFGKTHFETRKALVALGLAQQQLGATAEAERTLRRAVALHAVTGIWDNVEAITAAAAAGDLIAEHDPRGARIYFARATLGIRQRIDGARDYGPAAQAELRMFGPIFQRQVRVAWLSQAR
ncbi:tetratricopeptide repeat protein [Sphingomonas sp.]|uniref:tetratricopeptide repeat protein n=1 Tax=Sphingomonas sp. TaxID=28214 RepID=UPI001ED23280|nr:tetratricopeptide repeat protein [Sphingomonas sp.]MBX3594696.1 tetratricopeptide repeat protein [Sphingomonas sp.]